MAYGVDDVVSTIKGQEDNGSCSVQDAIHAVIYTYALVMLERKKAGNSYKGLSRKDYQKHKQEGFPNYWVVSQLIGGWSQVNSILPHVPQGVVDQRRGKASKATPRDFYEALLTVGDHYGIPASKVTMRQFSEYRAGHPESGVLDWKTYAKCITGRQHWGEAKKKAMKVGDET